MGDASKKKKTKRAPRVRKSLEIRHRLFVAEYLKDKNATRAYIAAGYAKASAEQCASRLLSQAKVAAAIEKAMAKKCVKLEITAERNLQRIAEIAYGKMKGARASDVLKACELLGKHFKQFSDIVEHTGIGAPQVVIHLPGNGSELPEPKTIETKPIVKQIENDGENEK